MGLEPLTEKWNSFGWNVIKIDGHNFNEIESSFIEAKKCLNKPSIIIANTIKGKGVSFMEGIPTWHGSVKLTDEDISTALSELNYSKDEIKGVIDV
jgi:transketolase